MQNAIFVTNSARALKETQEYWPQSWKLSHWPYPFFDPRPDLKEWGIAAFLSAVRQLVPFTISAYRKSLPMISPGGCEVY